MTFGVSSVGLVGCKGVWKLGSLKLVGGSFDDLGVHKGLTGCHSLT